MRRDAERGTVHFHSKNDRLAPPLHERNRNTVHSELKIVSQIAAWRHECAYVTGAPKCVVHQRRQSNALEAVIRATVRHLNDRLLTIKTGTLLNVMFQHKG